MLRSANAILAACLLLILGASSALAVTVTVKWTGSVTQTSGHAGIALNDTITGTFAYDSTAPQDTRTRYTSYNTDHTSSFVLNSYSGSMDKQSIALFGSGQLDSRNAPVVGTYTGDRFSDFRVTQIYVLLADNNNRALASSDLPTSLDPADWQLDARRASRLDGVGVEFVITSFSSTIQAAPIPVPASLPMIAFGMGMLVWFRRHKTSAT